MKTIVFEYEKSARLVLWELAILILASLKKILLRSLLRLWRICTVLAYAFFVPVKLYKTESVEGIPKEVSVREEYQKFNLPRGPFC